MGSLEEEILLQMVNDFIELGSSPTRDTNTTTTVTPDHHDHTKCYILQVSYLNLSVCTLVVNSFNFPFVLELA